MGIARVDALCSVVSDPAGGSSLHVQRMLVAAACFCQVGILDVELGTPKLKVKI
jgi:hypothetical protein